MPTTSGHGGQRAQTGSYIITLCMVPQRVTLRPPRAPHLQRFTFFTSCSRQRDGSERRYLHMGYFTSRTEAETWLQVVRRCYPQAIATVVPPQLRDVPLQSAGETTSRDIPVSLESTSLTDTQVLRVLETRGSPCNADDPAAQSSASIPLLGPEDTGTRRILREAVAQGAPVSFAVQLHWSAQPIDLACVPAFDLFRLYTLYTTETHREGRRPCYFLRLGFFADANSAKQVAVLVRSQFASAAVVPVSEQELRRARAARIDSASLASPAASIGWPLEPEQSPPHAPEINGRSATEDPEQQQAASSPVISASLQRKLEALARSEMSVDPDSESGVRHLKITVENRPSRRFSLSR
jgi:hypothetical protein